MIEWNYILPIAGELGTLFHLKSLLPPATIQNSPKIDNLEYH